MLAIRALPQQQQLLLCAAMRLLGAPPPDSPGPSGGFGTPCRVAQVSAMASPASSRRLSAGGAGRRLSTAGSCRTPCRTPRCAPLGRMHDCLLGELAEAYGLLCKQVPVSDL